MDWYSIGVAALIGGVSAGIGALLGGLVSSEKNRKSVGTVITVVLFSGLMAWASNTIIADHKEEVAMAELETAIVGNPAFDALKTHAPDAMEEVRSYFRQAVRENYDSLTVETGVRQIMSAVVGQRLPKSSDAALLNSIQLTVEQMKWLHEQGGDACFRLLFPHVDGGLQAKNAFSEELIARDFESTRNILSTYDANRAIPSEAEAMVVLTPVFQELFSVHGQENVAMLSDVTASDIDRSQACLIAIDMYAMILERPDSEAAIALRWVLN